VTALADEAVRLARLGVPVFPLHDASKEPRTPHGFLDASTGVETVKRWWRQWPNANIGARTGVVFDAIDVDGDNGFATLAALIAEHGSLDVGAIAETPGKVRDGRHVGKGAHYLTRPTGLGYTLLGPNVELKAAGGYVVVAPSVHPDGTGTYEWVERLDSLDQLRPAPDWVYAPSREREERRRRELAEREARRAARPATAGESPMERFNRTARWSEILEPHGWTYSHEHSDNAYWVRPGKRPSEGHSASINEYGDGVLYVFSTDAEPFDAGEAYSKFKAFSLLRHGGDDRTAARALVAWWKQEDDAWWVESA
jgi:hypothetical protein